MRARTTVIPAPSNSAKSLPLTDARRRNAERIAKASDQPMRRRPTDAEAAAGIVKPLMALPQPEAVRKAPKGRHQPGVMNQTEARYAARLDALVHSGEVSKYWFESMKVKLGPNCWYCPDFLVMLADQTLELHEVKGFMRDDSRVKLSVCKAMHPYPIWIAKWVSGAWEINPA